MCRGSAHVSSGADARDKPEHDERGVGGLCQQFEPLKVRASPAAFSLWAVERWRRGHPSRRR
ncbi:hypothetical protein GFM18_22970 [Rhizobium laguerreae]|nr:hypothetical protein [Rhizobium laguerreae]